LGAFYQSPEEVISVITNRSNTLNRPTTRSESSITITQSVSHHTQTGLTRSV